MQCKIHTKLRKIGDIIVRKPNNIDYHNDLNGNVHLIFLKFSSNEKNNYFCYMRIRNFIILSSFAISAFASQPRTIYLSFLNDFDGFADGVRVENRIEFHNETHVPKLALNDSCFDSHEFKVVARFANLNNDENKTYKAFDSLGKKIEVSNPSWGVVLDCGDSSTYYAVILQGTNSSPYDDVSDERKLKCSFLKHSNGKDTVIKEAFVKNNVNTFTGDNLLIIEHADGKTAIKLGNDKQSEIMVLVGAEYSEKLTAGIISYPGSKVSVERFVIKSKENPADKIKTQWTLELLEEHFRNSDDPNEGFWQYLDRDIEEKQLALGGNYKLALVKDGNGYAVIYVYGAKVNASKWKTGILKGYLEETVFSDEYNLVWYDSDMEAMTEELSAKIEQSTVLTLRFPIHKTQIRFAKKNTE